MSLGSELEPFKLRARRHRGRMLKALESADRESAAAEFKQAKAAIDEAFELLKRYPAPEIDSTRPAGQGERAVAQQLADFHGILGGLYRSRGDKSENDLEAAIEEYDKGSRYEMSERFHILNSYNLVNRLVLRILTDPTLLISKKPVERGKNMDHLLDEAAGKIEEQLGNGRDDVQWALADLAMLELLQEKGDVKSTLDELYETAKTDPYPLQSMLGVIRDLLRHDVPLQKRIIEVGEHLRSKLPESMKGEPLTS